MDDDLSVAWLVKRAVVSRILRGKPAPDINDVDNALIEGTNAGRLVWSSMVPDIIAKVVGRGPLEKEVAETYAHRLGEDLDAVSSKALKEGYTASLSKGIDRSLSWARVAEAWGLDSAQMRSFIGSMKEDAYSTDLIPRRSMKQLEVMLNTRADRINENESYAIGQLAKQIYWIKLQQTGEIGPDVRKRWHTAADERVCPVCGPIDQKVVSLTDVFAEGVFAPPVHPNCRCWTEIIESTVVTKRDYNRDQSGRFARTNSLVPASKYKFHSDPSVNSDMQRAAIRVLQYAKKNNVTVDEAWGMWACEVDNAKWVEWNNRVNVVPDGDDPWELDYPWTESVGDAEGSEEGYRFLQQYLSNQKRQAIAFDIDGVLANGSNKGALVDREVNPAALELIKESKKKGWDILIVTNRPNGWQAKTEEWLKKNDVPYDRLVMASDADPITSKVNNVKSLQSEYEIAVFYENDDKIRRALYKETGVVPDEHWDWDINDFDLRSVNKSATMVDTREYNRDPDGKFARINTLNMSTPEGHPFGRDTYGRPRPSRAEITRMQKETKPLKTGKGGYDIVGGYTEGAHPFGLPGMSLVPTRDEKYYQMQYRDWFDKKIDHDLFSPDEYYARTWALGIPYKQPTEEEIFTEEERANRAAKFKEIEDRWNDNVKRANAEERAPDMPSYEDLATYWHWDPEWATAAGRWEGKYREFHPSDKKKDISQHRMYQELAYDKKFNDEKKKELPPYEGLRRDGKKISYTPLPREYDDEFGLNPHNYPYRRVTTDSDAWKQFESDFITREAALTALREDPEIVNLIDRENRAKKGAELYRESQKVKTLADVYNAGSERNSQRIPINPKKYQQGLKLRRLRADIERRDSDIRQRAESVSKTITDVDTREYNRDPEGKFATVNTLVPKVEHTGPSIPKNRAKPIPQRQLSHREIARFTAIRDGRVITALDREEPVRDLKKVAVQQTVPYWRNTDINFVPQPAHPAVADTVEEVSQVIYDSKVRAGKKPKYKLKPKSVKMKIASPVEETKFDLSRPLPISPAPSEKVGTYTAKPEVRGLGADDVIFVVLPKKSRDSVIEGGRIDFSELPPLEAFDPAVVSLEELNLADTDQILMISGATWHPSKNGDGTGVLAGLYNVLTYRYIDEEAAFAIHAQRGIDAYVLAPDNPESTRVEDVIETNSDIVEGGRKARTTSYDNIDVREREEGADWVDPRGGAVLGSEFGPGYGTQQKWAKSVGLPKEEYDLTAWAKKEGLSRSAVEPQGYVDWASTQSPYKPNSLSKRLPWPRKVT